MPTVASARPATGSAPPPVFQPTPQFNQPQRVDDDTDDEEPAPNVPMPPNRGPVFNTFPQQPQQVNPQTGQPAEAAPTSYPSQPTAPFGGVAVPGMVAPVPQQPGQVQPGMPTPAAPVRRPGGPDGL
jgi:hypothetical protein